MPNIKSAIKRVKVTEKKNLRNRMIKSAMKTQIKKFETAVSANEADAKLLSATQGAVDKAAAKGVIHKNAANRKKAYPMARGAVASGAKPRGDALTALNVKEKGMLSTAFLF